MSISRGWGIAIGVAALVGVALFGLYLARLFVLHTFASEGDVPSSSSIALPTGAEISSESRDCASGGCWITLEVQPPSGQTPHELAAQLGLTPDAERPGNFWDPRTIWLSAEPGVSVLEIRADYWSGTAF